jgi:hypothetical protein
VKRPSRRLTTLGAALAMMLGSTLLTACSDRSPIQSVIPYTATDGISVNLGPLAIRDLLVVASASGQPGVLSGALVNTGTSDVTVTFAASGDSSASPAITVPTGQLVRIGTGQGAATVQLSTVSVAPGSLLPMRVATPPTGPRVLEVPVLSPALEYATLTPTPTPTPTPS